MYRAPLETYSGRIREVRIGTLPIGGENTMPFHLFEGEIPHPPRLALEVWDMEPEDWAEWVIEPYRDVLSDPILWAKRCEEYGAEAICLALISTDPAEKDTSPEEAAILVKKVKEAVEVPLIVWGSEEEKKDIAVLTKIAEVCAGENLLLGPLKRENYEGIIGAAREFGHSIIAQTALDINLQKELNIKICKSFPAERVVIDPLSPCLGYGLEYAFSAMERIKLAALSANEAMLQMPIFAYVAKEAWKTKEAKESKEQGILWEGISALTLILAGANIVVLRHPETLKQIREMIKEGR